MSKYCTNCGTQLEDEDAFCYVCGEPQEVDDLPDETTTIKETVPTSNQSDETAILEDTSVSTQTDDTPTPDVETPVTSNQSDETTILEDTSVSTQTDNPQPS